MKAVHAENIEWPVFYNDMFPYADDDQSYWTGFFSSRAALKGFVRDSSAHLRSAENLLAQYSLKSGVEASFINANI